MTSSTYRIFFLLSLINCVTRSPKSPDQDQALFTYSDKVYYLKDLPDITQQRFYSEQFEIYKDQVSYIQDEIIKLYVKDLAEKENKSEQDIKAQLLTPQNPTEQDIREFYQQNKDSIPYPIDIIEEELKRLIIEERTEHMKSELISNISQEKHLTLLLKRPSPPSINIDTAHFPRLGNPHGKIKIIEFADFQCPYCKAATKVFDDLVKKYNNDIEYVFMHNPTKSFLSEKLAEGSYCADQQNKFWQYHDLAFADQINASAGKIAQQLKLNLEQFDKCYESEEAADFVKRSKDLADQLGIHKTPTVFINGKVYEDEISVEAISRQIDLVITSETPPSAQR